MKTKVIVLQLLMLLASSFSVKSQTAAVSNLSTEGITLSPEIAGKLTRIELNKTGEYKVIDQFDMESALEGKGNFDECYGKNCLIQMGEMLNVDYVLCGSIDKLGNRIVVSLKLIDVKSKSVYLTNSIVFSDQSDEIQRMIEITLSEMLGKPIDEEAKKKLLFNPEVITSTNVSKISNSGPRFGISVVALGDMNDFFSRSKRDGGLESIPMMSNLGYQFEVQYVGTENFSALFEVIPNVGGLEQGNFVPTLSLMNGFRFGKAGWEFAFGPSFGARRVVDGITLEDGTFQTSNEYSTDHRENWYADSSNYDSNGYLINNYQSPSMTWESRLDTRGDLQFNTNWIMAFGRTFRSGALNIPVNVYYSGNKYGAVFGASVGFNIVQRKQKINGNLTEKF